MCIRLFSYTRSCAPGTRRSDRCRPGSISSRRGNLSLRFLDCSRCTSRRTIGRCPWTVSSRWWTDDPELYNDARAFLLFNRPKPKYDIMAIAIDPERHLNLTWDISWKFVAAGCAVRTHWSLSAVKVNLIIDKYAADYIILYIRSLRTFSIPTI